MNRYLKYFPFILLVLVVVLIFKQWFLPGLISSGDFWYTFSSSYNQYNMFAFAWNWIKGNGLGTFSPLYQAINLDFGIPVFVFRFLGWSILERLGFFYPYIFLSLFSIYFLYRKVGSKRNLFFVSALIFPLNTYILTVISGGQIVIANAYALLPLIIYIFWDLLIVSEKKHYTNSLLAGLLLSIQIVLDLRIAYISGVAILALFLFGIVDKKYKVRKIIFGLFVPFAIAGLTNFFWILPVLINRSNPLNQLGEAYVSTGSVKFFSFAQFENSISLLHPNWPENVFGKVSFMKPEFIILPILAFLSLLFIYKIKDKNIKKFVTFFSFLALLGVFLAKGANEPFGDIYIWLFNHIPGFVMFRDPTKWYALTAVSYAILIPFTIDNIFNLVKTSKYNLKNRYFNLQNLFVSFVVLLLLFLIKPALFGELGGTLKPTTLSNEYISFEKFVSSDEKFYRTLWIPVVQRFAYYSQNHPSISAQDFYLKYDNSKLIKEINRKDSEKILQESGVKYVIVPYDSKKEIFLTDRKYDERVYSKTVEELKTVSYLSKVKEFGKIIVFEVPNPKDHFWTPSEGLSLSYKYVSPVEYRVDVKNARPGDIVVFSENFDRKWQATNTSNKSDLTYSTLYDNRFNSFILRVAGSYGLDIYYYPQVYVNIGLFISLATLIVTLGILIVVYKRKI